MPASSIFKVHNITNISSNLTVAAPLYNVQVDPQKAAAHGLTAQQVSALLREVYTGTAVTTVNFNGEQEDANLLLGTLATTDARTAVIEGGRRRLRPILMTAVATILALLPMALGLSKESGFIAAPLAITVIGGLTTSTILTLLLVPTLYVLVEGRKDRKAGPPEDEKSSEQAHSAQEAATQAVVQEA